MKISITLNNKTHSVESEDQFDGQEVQEMVEQFKGLLVSAGYHPESVDEHFNTEYQWFFEEKPHDKQYETFLHNYSSQKEEEVKGDMFT
jgi:Tat protein secretion system quality control protein TatD with DNase activity